MPITRWFAILLILIAGILWIDCNAIEPREIYDICTKRYNYDRCDIVAAMPFVESRYDRLAYNEDEDAIGLFQMKCPTARMVGLKYGCDQLFNPVIATRFCILYLKMLDKGYTDEELIAAYNAGTVKYCKHFNNFRWGICYPGELQNIEHVNKVMRHLKYLREYYIISWIAELELT